MQQSFAKQPSNEQSNQSNQGGDEYGTIIGVKSEPGCRCVNLTFNQMTKLNSSSCEMEEVAKEGKTTSHASPLPSDIPTLESLAQSSPKLSTWRQTRIISEKLEQVGNWDLSFSCKCVLSSSLIESPLSTSGLGGALARSLGKEFQSRCFKREPSGPSGRLALLSSR